MQHYKFPHIEQLKNVLVSLKHKYQNPVQTSDGWKFDESLPLPEIAFEGTIKLHGANCAVVLPYGEPFYCQSRETILTPNSDYKGFAQFIHAIGLEAISGIVPDSIKEEANENKSPIVIYGEWCGKGIQAGVAISELPRMFVVFAVKVGNRWCDTKELYYFHMPDKNIYSVYLGGGKDSPALYYNVVVNFNNPNSIVDSLTEVTLEVEKECPFAKSFGISGTGEGIVWKSLYDCRTKTFCGGDEGEPWMFKTKGEKHKNIKEAKPIQLESVVSDDVLSLIPVILTEQRLNQGLDKLEEMKLELSKKSTAAFMKWVGDDIKRECRDILEKLSPKDEVYLSGIIMKQVREWFFKKVG